MLRIALALALGITAVVAFSVSAEDKKDDTKKIEGKLVCTKCTLSETDKCGHAVKTKEGGKDVVYYIKDNGAKESFHKGVCPAGTEEDVVVTGKVSEKDGKKWITDAKVEVKK